MKSGVIYLRVSTQEQKDSRLGLESQEALCREYCTRNEIALICDPIRDEAVSASIPLYEREGGRRLIDLAKGGELVVVALGQDRLFRSVIDCLATLERWSELDVTAMLVDGGQIETETDEGWLKVAINAMFGEYERRKVSTRTRRALRAAKARGQKIGVAPFGMKNAVTFDGAGRKINAGVHVVDEAEARVVARVKVLSQFCRMRNGRVNLTKIASTLAAEGFPTRNGGEWTHVQVANLLRRIA